MACSTIREKWTEILRQSRSRTSISLANVQKTLADRAPLDLLFHRAPLIHHLTTLHDHDGKRFLGSGVLARGGQQTEGTTRAGHASPSLCQGRPDAPSLGQHPGGNPHGPWILHGSECAQQDYQCATNRLYLNPSERNSRVCLRARVSRSACHFESGRTL